MTFFVEDINGSKIGMTNDKQTILLEHSSMPGIQYENVLMYGDVGCCVLNEMHLEEVSDNSGFKLLKFRGKFQEANAINKNKRMYPFDVLDGNVKRLEESIKNGSLIGELDHPQDSIVHFKDASHRISKLWWEGRTLMGEGVILSTPAGRVLKSLINDGVRIGISSRGVGNGKVNEEGILVIGESYKLITFDAVADPSTYAAFQEKVVSKENYNHYQNNNEKNENKSIHKLAFDKELILACFNGILNQKVQEQKQRVK